MVQMARQALVIGDAVESDDQIEATLARYGIEGIRRARNVGEALELLAKTHVEVVFAPMDALTEPLLVQLDRALRRDRPTEVIGTAPSQDPELMLRAMRAGIQEFLVRPIVAADLASAMDRITRRTSAGASLGTVIACYSAKGGVGVSSVAANLATALATVQAKARVAVADFVVPNGEQRLLFNAGVAYDIADVAGKADRLDVEMLNSVLAPVRDGVWLLASSERPEADDAIDAAVVTAVLQHLRSSYTYTVVDCEHQLNDRTLAALDAADRIVYVTQLNVSALRGAQRALNLFRRLGYSAEKLCVVVNRYQSGDVLSVSEATSVLKTEVYFRIPNDYKTMSEALTRGIPVSQVEGSAKITQAFDQLARKLSGRGEGTAPSARAAQNGSRSGLRSIFSRKKG
jgi:pilus assembly protein CpaE